MDFSALTTFLDALKGKKAFPAWIARSLQGNAYTGTARTLGRTIYIFSIRSAK